MPRGRMFKKGGRLEKLYPLYEAGDTFMFSPGYTTKSASHVRDGLDLKRMMFTVVIALIPCTLMAMYNTGYQIHRVVEAGGAPLETWQTVVFQTLGLQMASSSFLANLVHGALYFLPVALVTYAVGGMNRGRLRRRARARNQRRLPGYRVALPPDPAGHDSPMAGRHRHCVRDHHRQGRSSAALG